MALQRSLGSAAVEGRGRGSDCSWEGYVFLGWPGLEVEAGMRMARAAEDALLMRINNNIIIEQLARGRMTKISRCHGVEVKEKIAVVWWLGG